MFPVIEQRNAQGNLVRAHLPISFKLFKDLKVICAQYGTMAPFFTKTIVENMSLLALPPSRLEAVGHNLSVRRELIVVEN